PEAAEGGPGGAARGIGGDLSHATVGLELGPVYADRSAGRGVRRAVPPRRAAFPAGVSRSPPRTGRRDPRAVPRPGPARAGRGAAAPRAARRQPPAGPAPARRLPRPPRGRPGGHG